MRVRAFGVAGGADGWQPGFLACFFLWYGPCGFVDVLLIVRHKVEQTDVAGAWEGRLAVCVLVMA